MNSVWRDSLVRGLLPVQPCRGCPGSRWLFEGCTQATRSPACQCQQGALPNRRTLDRASGDECFLSAPPLPLHYSGRARHARHARGAAAVAAGRTDFIRACRVSPRSGSHSDAQACPRLYQAPRLCVGSPALQRFPGTSACSPNSIPCSCCLGAPAACVHTNLYCQCMRAECLSPMWSPSEWARVGPVLRLRSSGCHRFSSGCLGAVHAHGMLKNFNSNICAAVSSCLAGSACAGKQAHAQRIRQLSAGQSVAVWIYNAASTSA